MGVGALPIPPLLEQERKLTVETRSELLCRLFQTLLLSAVKRPKVDRSGLKRRLVDVRREWAYVLPQRRQDAPTHLVGANKEECASDCINGGHVRLDACCDHATEDPQSHLRIFATRVANDEDSEHEDIGLK